MSGNHSLESLSAAQEAFDKTLAGSSSGSAPWTPELVKFICELTLGFTCVALILCTFLLYVKNGTPQQILRTFGVLTIIGMSTVLLVVGYSNEQLTPIVGLFGAIAGYLLGKDSGVEQPKGR